MAEIQSTADRPFFKPLPEHDTRTINHRLWRIASKVSVSDLNCWVWLGQKNGGGYGVIEVNRSRIALHRFIYSRVIAQIPDGLCVLHTCDNPPCCNPAHLFVGDEQVNNRDCVAKGRHPELKLSDDQALEVRRRAAGAKRGMLPKIAVEFGVSLSTINRIIHGQCRHHLGDNEHRSDDRMTELDSLRGKTPKLLKQFRQSRKLDQKQAGSLLGFSNTYICRIESGDRVPCDAFCLALQSVLAKGDSGE